MFKVEDILARLQNGEDANVIATEMVNALNAANEQFQKEEEAKKKEIEIRNKKKVTDLQAILDLMHDFCIDYYCDNNDDIDSVNAVFADLKAEEVIKQIEGIGVQVAQLENAMKDFGNMFDASPVKIKSMTVDKDADRAIQSFLKSIGL